MNSQEIMLLLMLLTPSRGSPQGKREEKTHKNLTYLCSNLRWFRGTFEKNLHLATFLSQEHGEGCFLLIVFLPNHARKKEALQRDCSGQLHQCSRSIQNPMAPKVIQDTKEQFQNFVTILHPQSCISRYMEGQGIQIYRTFSKASETFWCSQA